MSEVAVIIVNWNSRVQVEACLESLYGFTTIQDLEVIVIDGASYDGCDQMVATKFPSVKYLQAESNVGFAKANNLASKTASSKFLLFLNPDTELVDDAIPRLLRAARTLPRAGIIGCKLLNADRSLQMTSVLNFPTITNRVLDSEYLRRKFPRSGLWGHRAFLQATDTAFPVEAVSGACILISRELFDKVGGFTEDYFMYAEDIDLCYKVRNMGLEVYHNPDVAIIHYGGASTATLKSTFSSVMLRESCYRFFLLRRGTVYACAYRAATGFSALVRLALIPFLIGIRHHAVQHSASSITKWKAIFIWALTRTTQQ